MKFAIILLSLVLFGCDDQYHNKNKEVEETESKQELIDAQGKIIKAKDAFTLEFFDSPNSYYVELSHQIDANQILEIKLDDLIMYHDLVSNYRLSPIKLIPNNKYTFAFLDPLTNSELGVFSVDVPLDKVIDQVELDFLLRNSTGDLVIEANRVFFNGVIKVMLGSRGLKIKSNYLYFENSQFFSFYHNVFAKGHGRPGPSISIESEKIFGKAYFNLNGENAGPGHDTKTLQKEVSGRGDRGIAYEGKWGSEELSIPISGWMPVTVRKCKRKPGDGRPGKVRGLKGKPGGTGFNGGDSGHLRIVGSDTGEFDYSYEIRGGKGGIGGAGGPGGLGQRGGDPGYNPVVDLVHKDHKRMFLEVPRGKVCPDAKEGPRAPQGPTGDRGTRGKDGKSKDVCITTNKDGNCEGEK